MAKIKVVEIEKLPENVIENIPENVIEHIPENIPESMIENIGLVESLQGLRPVIENIGLVESLPEKKTKEKKPTQEKKPQLMGKCENCNKEMTLKTLKYSHKKLCTAPLTEKLEIAPEPVSKPEPEQEPVKAKIAKKPVKSVDTTPVLKSNVVEFEHSSPKIQSQADLYNQNRQQRLIQRQTRFKSLISQAF